MRAQVGCGAAGQAAALLAELSREHGVIRRQLSRAGVVLPIVELLRSGPDYERMMAAAALETMSLQADMLLDMEQAGLTPILAEASGARGVMGCR